MNGKNHNLKIRSSKSEAIYNVLEDLLQCSNDYYERETFIYHHSVVTHDIKTYKLKPITGRDPKVKWFFTITDKNPVDFKCEEGTDMDIFLESAVLQNKVNTLIKHILENK